MIKKIGTGRYRKVCSMNHTKKSRPVLTKTVGVNGFVFPELTMEDLDIVSTPGKITGVNGCSAAVKALRVCFKEFLELHVDHGFTGRLMKMVSHIYKLDKKQPGVKRSVLFTLRPGALLNINFHNKRSDIDLLQNQFNYSHSESRKEARLWIDHLKLRTSQIPNGATHFRVVNHLSVISDYAYSEENGLYEPLGDMNGMSVFGYSKYCAIWTDFSTEIVVSFPENRFLSDDVCVMQCYGIEFVVISGQTEFLPIGNKSGVMICDVF